eukprot:1117763-Rhodomonas_salina.1
MCRDCQAQQGINRHSSHCDPVSAQPSGCDPDFKHSRVVSCHHDSGTASKSGLKRIRVPGRVSSSDRPAPRALSPPPWPPGCEVSLTAHRAGGAH